MSLGFFFCLFFEVFFTVKLAKFASAYSKVGFGMFVIIHLSVTVLPHRKQMAH